MRVEPALGQRESAIQFGAAVRGSEFRSRWEFGDRVFIDGDQSIKGTITGFCFRPSLHTVEVSWVHNGDSKSAWFDHFRLQRADAS